MTKTVQQDGQPSSWVSKSWSPKNEEGILKSVGQDMSCTGVVNQL